MDEVPIKPPLLCQIDGQWCPVPAWAEFFRGVGRRSVEGDLRNATIGLLVPTRAYVAAFVALGAVEASLELTTGGLDDLETLVKGDRLSVSKAEKMVKATFIRYATEHGNDGMWLLSQGRWFLPKTEWRRVSRGDFGATTLGPVPIDHRERRSWDKDFVKSVLGIDSLDPLVVGNRLIAVTIGIKVDLSRELEHEDFAVELPSGRIVEGHLEDAIRTRSFANNTERDSFRTEVESQRHPKISERILDLRPSVLICDTAEAFIKHRRTASNSCLIAVFDLTSRATRMAISEFERDYAARLDTESEWPFDADPPPGVSVSMFQRQR